MKTTTDTKQDGREADIIKLCAAVIDVIPVSRYNPHGANSSTCPFCHEKVLFEDADMPDIKHAPECAYLIAKDLSTGIL